MENFLHFTETRELYEISTTGPVAKNSQSYQSSCQIADKMIMIFQGFGFPFSNVLLRPVTSLILQKP